MSEPVMTPTVPGYYWRIDQDGAERELVLLSRRDGRMRVATMQPGPEQDLSEVGGEFYGPIRGPGGAR